MITDNQRQILNRLLDGFDMCDSWFGYLKDGELVDVSFDNFEEIYGKKITLMSYFFCYLFQSLIQMLYKL